MRTIKKRNKKSKRQLNRKKTRRKKKTKQIYSDNDYSSTEGMLTSVWGPPLWHYLHTMSFNYPINPTKEQKNHYKSFILNLKNVLPCRYCRVNLKKNLKTLPLKDSDMKNRKTFSLYVYNLHEIVNKLLKKKSSLTYGEVRERYEHFRSRCTANEKGAKYETRIYKNNTKKKKARNKKEKGCVVPLYGKKSKCIIKIVPKEKKTKTFQIDQKCIKTRKKR